MKKSISSKALSLFMAVLFIALSAPFAFAADPIALKATHVTAWPTAEGEIFFGEPLGKIKLVGGEVQYNGVVVPGHFEHIDPDAYAEEADNAYAGDIKFVPDDKTTYKGFNKMYSKTTFTIKKTTPILKDNNNPPVAIGTYEPGLSLTDVAITGGEMINPYVENEKNVGKVNWEWTNPDTVLTESREYEAYYKASGNCYNKVTKMIYVDVFSPIPVPEITEVPTVDAFEYIPDMKCEDIELKGGKAVANGVEIPGTFAVSDYYKNLSVVPGTYNIEIVFIPDDEKQALEKTFEISVTVNKGTVKFVDESGNEIVPEIILDRSLKVGNDLNGYLKQYTNVSCSFNWEETEGYDEKIKPGTHEYTVKTITDDPNYERYNYLKFKVIANREKVEAKIQGKPGSEKIYFENDGGNYVLYGTFDVKYFIDGKEGGVIKGIKKNQTFSVPRDKSGVYTYEITYNGTADDYYDVTVIAPEPQDIKLSHNVTVNGVATPYTYGAPVTVNAPANEKPYYVFTGWSEVKGDIGDATADTAEVKFTMPDEDVEFTATYEFSFVEFIKWIFATIADWFKSVFALIGGAE